MRVLMCIATMGAGGAERQVTYLAGGLKAHGVDVHVGLLDGGPNAVRLQRTGVPAHVVSVYPSGRRFVGPLVHLMRRVQPDVVYLWQRPFDVLGGIAARICRLPCVHAERTDPDRVPPGPKVWMRKKVVALSDGVIANSTTGEAYWRRRLPRAKLVACLPNIVPVEELSAVQAASESAGHIVVVGRLDANKNVLSLLRAVERLGREGMAVPVLVIGEGPASADISAFVEAHQMSGLVRLAGYREDVWALMKGSRLVVSLSLVEGEPNAVLEAAALGCPLLLSDIAAHRSAVPAGQALFVEPGRTDAVVAALRQCLHGVRAEASSAPDAIEHWQRRSAGAISAAHAQLFDAVVGRARTR